MNHPGRTRAIAATLLAFIVPGAGHMLLGLSMKGLLLLAATLADLIAMIHYADLSGGRYALLLIFLGFSIPAFWFYSVFDTLQQTARLRETSLDQLKPPSRAVFVYQGGAITLLGLVMLAMLQSPAWLLPTIESAGIYAPGAGLAVIALLLLVQRRVPMFRMGRVTAAIVMLTVGGLLLWDQLKERNDIALLGRWWPVVFILVGLEVVVFGVLFRKSSKRLSFDIGGALLALIVAVTSYSVTQYSTMPFKWLDQWKDNLTGISGYSEEKGFQYKLDLVAAPIPADLEELTITNPNGKVIVRAGDVQSLQVESDIWIDSEDQMEADAVAEGSQIEKKQDGDKLSIEAKAKTYGANGGRVPRINMTITIPNNSHLVSIVQTEAEEAPGTPTETLTAPGSSEDHTTQDAGQDTGETNDANGLELPTQPKVPSVPAVKLAIHVTNGPIDVSGLTLPGGLDIDGTSGEITVSEITGNVDVETKNGGITVNKLTGNLSATTYNGNIASTGITGTVEASTLSGTLTMAQIGGNAELDTKNGEIVVREAAADLQADTLNGDIEIHSAVVGGDWNINSSIGDIRLFVPDQGNYTVNGSVTFGSIVTELPLTIGKKTIRGDIGAGGSRIDIDANSSIAIRRYVLKPGAFVR